MASRGTELGHFLCPITILGWIFSERVLTQSWPPAITVNIRTLNGGYPRMLTLRAATLPDPHWIDFVLQHFDCTLSVTRTLARLEAIRVETADMKTLVLRP